MSGTAVIFSSDFNAVSWKRDFAGVRFYGKYYVAVQNFLSKPGRFLHTAFTMVSKYLSSELTSEFDAPEKVTTLKSKPSSREIS